MYFAEDESTAFYIWLRDKVGMKKDNSIPLEDHLSERARFTVRKLNKHGGFILEAFLEALPQSILQLIAMVYYEETSYIAVGSIILSMTSIMSKSLVISQGLDWKSYIWTWLCVCTDFFSIFFVVSWTFLSNDYINGDFLGHFSIIGEVWCWKVMGIVPFFALVWIIYFCYEIWAMLFGFLTAQSSCLVKCGNISLFLCANVMILSMMTIGSVIGMLLAEIVCFSFVAVIIFICCTADRWEYHDKNIAKVLKVLHGFISEASFGNNDRVIRILAVNYAYDSIGTGTKTSQPLGKFIENQRMEKRLHQVTYTDIRQNCNNSKRAKLGLYLWNQYLEIINPFEFWSWLRGKDWNNPDDVALEIPFGSLWFVSMLFLFPIYLLSRIMTVLFPYFIVAYLSYHGLWSEMNLFELAMLGCYIGMQAMILILGFFVFRTHWWLWHVNPGFREYDQIWPKDLNPFLTKMYSFYDSVQWEPVARRIVLKQLGPDIGPIVMYYVEAMDDVVMP